MITIVNMPCASGRTLRLTYLDDRFVCCEFVEADEDAKWDEDTKWYESFMDPDEI
jgi:hypothetical protein